MFAGGTEGGQALDGDDPGDPREVDGGCTEFEQVPEDTCAPKNGVQLGEDALAAPGGVQREGDGFRGEAVEDQQVGLHMGRGQEMFLFGLPSLDFKKGHFASDLARETVAFSVVGDDDGAGGGVVRQNFPQQNVKDCRASAGEDGLTREACLRLFARDQNHSRLDFEELIEPGFEVRELEKVAEAEHEGIVLLYTEGTEKQKDTDIFIYSVSFCFFCLLCVELVLFLDELPLVQGSV